MPECSTATAAQCWSWNHAFLKREKEDVCLAAVHAWSFPRQPNQKSPAEQEGGPALIRPPTLLSPNLYFLGSPTCMSFFLSTFPTPCYSRLLSPCPLPEPSSLALPALLEAHVRGPHPSHGAVTGVTTVPAPLWPPTRAGLEVQRKGSGRQKEKIQQQLLSPHSHKKPHLWARFSDWGVTLQQWIQARRWRLQMESPSWLNAFQDWPEAVPS